MLFNLVKKDLLLAKKYLVIMFIFAIAAPIYIQLNSGGGFADFFVTALMVQYMILNTVAFSEEKSKGPVLLCATPYTRRDLVRARYLFIMTIFVCCYLIYTITACLSPIHMEMLDIYTLGISFLGGAVCFGIMIPFQYRFGYEKIRYIFFCVIFLSIFSFPAIAKWLQSSNISFHITLPLSQGVQYITPWLIALIIGYISLIASLHIYCRKDL